MLIEQGAMQKSQQATCGHRLDNTLTTHYPIDHHMALQTMWGPGLPCWGFATITFLQGRIVSPAPKPQPGYQASVFMAPGHRVAQLYPQALGTHFSRLLRHAWVTVGLFFHPCHHTETLSNYQRHTKTGVKWFKTMEQNPSWEHKCLSESQDISRLLWKMKFIAVLIWTRQKNLIPRIINPVHILTHTSARCFFKIHFNIIF
jgi:hypothetical protein